MKRQSLAIYIMMLGTFSILSTEMGMIGILPQVAHYFNITIDQAGLFVSLFAIGSAVSGLILPLLFGRYNRKKVFTLSLLIFEIFTAVSAFTTDFYIALLCRVIISLFMPIYCGLSLTVAGEIVPKEEARDSISKVIMGVSAGMIIGVPITAYFASYFGYEIAMLWFTFVNLLALVATVVLFPSIPGKEQSYGSQVSEAKSMIFIVSVLGVIMLNCGQFLSYSYVSEFLQSVTHIINLDLTILLFLYGFTSIFGNWVGGKLLSSRPHITVILTPIFLSLIFVSLFLVGSSTIPTGILVIFWGLIAGIINNILQFWIVTAAPKAPEFANGIFLSMANIGVTIGTSIGGVIIVNQGTSFIFLGSIVVLMISLILFGARIKLEPSADNS